MSAVVLFVPGRPAPQGSKTRTKFAMIDANAITLHPWRDAVRHDMAKHLADQGTPPIEGPIEIHLTFSLPKPASTPKRRRTWPTSKMRGDLDKLCRAVFDACTDARLWLDDSQVVVLQASKDWAENDQPTGVQIVAIPFQE